MKYWKDDAIFEVECPKCKTAVEFYKDDTTRKCGNCGHRFVNPKMDFGCASYCQFAEQCLGTLPEEFMGSREDLLKDKVAVEMKRYFHKDFKSIRLATNTAANAESIGKAEGGNLAIVLCAAYLYDTGIEAAQEILRKAGANDIIISEIVALLEELNKEETGDTLHARIVQDALTIRQLQNALKEESINKEGARQLISQKLSTSSAQSLATALLE